MKGLVMFNEAVHHRCRNLDGDEMVVKSSDYEELRKLFLDKEALIVDLASTNNNIAIPTFQQALKSIVDK